MQSFLKSSFLIVQQWVTRGRHSLFVVGILAALAWAPYHHIWGLVLSLNLLMVRLWFAHSLRDAFWCGWWWGWGFYISTLFWIGHSLWVDPQRFAWVWPFSVLGLPALFACYPALASLLIRYVRQWMTPIAHGACFIGVWASSEMLQGHLFTGFPWNLVAYIWAPFLPIAQLAAFIGSYGLSLATLGIFCLPGIGILQGQRFFLKNTLFAATSLISFYFLGYHRLLHTPTSFVPKVTLRLVQPSIRQKEKGDARYAHFHFNTLVTLSHLHTKYDPTHVIWPEGALPWSFSPTSLDLFPPIYQETKPFILLTGGTYHSDSQTIFNSVMLHEPGKNLALLYAKTHLLPFGEYIPQRTFLSHFFPSHWLKKVTPGSQDFSPGPPTYLSHCPGVPPFRTLICYEVIFPGTICPKDIAQRPQWILNVTNDAWFGHSPGPHQHFASARFRAIEEGLPLVRAANTGISAIIDPLGRIVGLLPLYFQGILDGHLPQALPPTIYSQLREGPWVIMMIILASLIFIPLLPRKKSTYP